MSQSRIPLKLRLGAASLAAAGLMSLLPSAAGAITVGGIVPNRFERTCSHVTRRCTPYRQINGGYNGSVPSVWVTKSCWCWI